MGNKERTPSIKHKEMQKIYNHENPEFFTAGELLAIKSQGDVLIDPLPILARFGIVTDRNDELFDLLCSNNRALRFVTTDEGVRFHSKDIEELVIGSKVSMWQIATEGFISSQIRESFYQDALEGFTALKETMASQEKQRVDKADTEWTR